MSRLQIVSAADFSLEKLADAYNQTRIDYIVPMPMNVARLREYIHVYDVDIKSSCAAVLGDEIIGIGMLGRRGHEGWITRLGVLPDGRRRGTGRAIMTHLLDMAGAHGVTDMWLEVIQGNTPAHSLFCDFGFVETDELIVARRPPTYESDASQGYQPPADMQMLPHEGALALLEKRRGHQAWTNQLSSFHNSGDLSAIRLVLPGRGSGWVVFKASLLRLTRIVVEIEEGDAAFVAETLLRTLHHLYSTQDAIAENFSVHDPVWLGFQAVGYFDAFRRIEMVRR